MNNSAANSLCPELSVTLATGFRAPYPCTQWLSRAIWMWKLLSGEGGRERESLIILMVKRLQMVLLFAEKWWFLWNPVNVGMLYEGSTPKYASLKKKFWLIYFFGCTGSSWPHRALFSCGSRGYLLVAVRRATLLLWVQKRPLLQCFLLNTGLGARPRSYGSWALEHVLNSCCLAA